VTGVQTCALPICPLQCRTFPWWSEHLGSDRAWRALGRACEGVGRGNFVPIDEITKSLRAQRTIDATDAE
jgi:uncharacterized protein